MKKSNDFIPLAVFDDLPLYLRHSPTIENTVGGRNRSVHCRFNSRRQLIYRIANGLAKVIQFLPVHPPIEGFTDIGAGQPKLDVVLFVGQRVLVMCEHETSRRRREENLLESW